MIFLSPLKRLQLRILSKRVFVLILLYVVFSSTAHASVIILATLARTYDFNESSGLPVSAKTDFICGWDSTDPLQVAEHELLHAIGFTTAYSKFTANVKKTPNDDGTLDFIALKPDLRVFAQLLNEGTKLGHLSPSGTGQINTPSGTQTFDQSKDIMIPTLNTSGTAPGPLDKMILDSVFNWSEIGIDITVNSQDPSIQNAKVAITNLFGGPKENAHPFVWDVKFVASEPNTMSIFTLGLGLVLLLHEFVKIRKKCNLAKSTAYITGLLRRAPSSACTESTRCG